MNFKDLLRRTAFEKISHNRAFHIIKHPKYDGYQRGHASFFDINTADGAADKSAIKSKNT